MQAVSGYGRRCVAVVEYHHSFEVVLEGGPYSDGRRALPDQTSRL
jgi:hypothetical protein